MIFFSGKEKTENLLDQAMGFMEKGQFKTAIPLFKKTLKQDPKNITALTRQLRLIPNMLLQLTIEELHLLN